MEYLKRSHIELGKDGQPHISISSQNIGRSAEEAGGSLERQKLVITKNNIELGKDSTPNVQSFY